jgi:hypothetical protein
MSISIVKHFEPRLNIKPDRVYSVPIGGQDISYRSYAANTSAGSQVSWSFTTPGVRIGIVPCLLMDFVFKFTRTGSAAVIEPPVTSTNAAHGVRQWPVHSCIEVANVSFNGTTLTFEPADVIHALLNYGNDSEDRQYHMSGTAHFPDQFYRFDAGEPWITGAGAGARSPFAKFLDSSQIEDSRNVSLFSCNANGDRIPNPPQGDAEFYIRCQEYLMMSPFKWGKVQSQCLFGIQDFDLNLTMKLNEINAWAGFLAGNTGVFPLVNNSVYTQTVADRAPRIHLVYITPQPDVVIPPLLHYPYYEIRRHRGNTRQTITTASDAPEDYQFQNLQLGEIPKRMYIYAKDFAPNPVNTGTGSSFRAPDWFANIKALNITFDAAVGRFTSYKSIDLCRVSQENGYKRSFFEWEGSVGSVMCIEFGKDLALNPLLAPGVRGSFELQVAVRFRNQGHEDITFQPYIVLVPEGVFSIDDQLISRSIGTLTEIMVAQAPFVDLPQSVVPNYQGGNFGPNLAKFAKGMRGPAADALEYGAKAASAAAPYVRGKGPRSTGGSRNTTGGRSLRATSLARRT